MKNRWQSSPASRTRQLSIEARNGPALPSGYEQLMSWVPSKSWEPMSIVSSEASGLLNFKAAKALYLHVLPHLQQRAD